MPTASRSMHANARSVRRAGRIARAAVLVGATALAPGALPGQVPGQAGTLTIEVHTELYGTTYFLRNVQTCVGNKSDPKAYGIKWTGLDGRATHTGVPLGAEVYITADMIQGVAGFGHLQGQRLNYVLKSSGLSLIVNLPISKLQGPNCSTAIGREPSLPSKNLPVEVTEPPAVHGTLKLGPASIINAASTQVTLYTTSGFPNFLEVNGVPTHTIVTSSATPPSPTQGGWTPVSVVGWGRIAQVTRSVSGEGKHDLYLYLKNTAGVSPGYKAEVTLLDPSPCLLEWTRYPDGQYWGSNGTKESFSIARGGSKGWAGDGTNVRNWANKGPRPIVIGFTRVDQNGNQSSMMVDTLSIDESGYAPSFLPLRHMKYANCP